MEVGSTGGSASDGPLWLLAAGNLIVGVGAFMIIGLMSPMTADLQLSPTAAGWVVSIYALAYAVSSPLLTVASGRSDRRVVLALALAIFGSGMIVTATATSIGLLYSGRAVSAIGAAMFTPGAAAVAVAMVPGAARGRALSLIFTGFTLAQVAGVPAGSWLGYTLGWRAVFTATGLVAIAAGLVVLLALPHRIAVPPTTVVGFGRVLRNPSLAVSSMFFCTSMAAGWVPYTFLGPMIEWKLAGGRDLVASLLFIYGLGALLGNVLGGRITDRLGPDRTLLATVSLNVAMLGLVPTLPWTYAAGAALLFVWAANGWSTMVPQQARLVALSPGDAQVLLSLNASAVYIGGALGSAIGAATVERGGFWWTGPVGAITGLVALAHLVVALRLAPRPAKGVS